MRFCRITITAQNLSLYFNISMTLVTRILNPLMKFSGFKPHNKL